MTRIGRPLHQRTRVPGWSTTPRRTICCPAEPELYVVLDALRRAKQRDTGSRVTLNAVVLELILTHPRVAPKLPRPLPEG
jgi:hypothetical protein